MLHQLFFTITSYPAFTLCLSLFYLSIFRLPDLQFLPRDCAYIHSLLVNDKESVCAYKKKLALFTNYRSALCLWVPLVAQMVKHLPAIQDIWVWSLGREEPLEEWMATHSSIPVSRIPRTEKPGGLQSIGSWLSNQHSHTYTQHKGLTGQIMKSDTECSNFGSTTFYLHDWTDFLTSLYQFPHVQDDYNNTVFFMGLLWRLG